MVLHMLLIIYKDDNFIEPCIGSYPQQFILMNPCSSSIIFVITAVEYPPYLLQSLFPQRILTLSPIECLVPLPAPPDTSLSISSFNSKLFFSSIFVSSLCYTIYTCPAVNQAALTFKLHKSTSIIGKIPFHLSILMWSSAHIFLSVTTFSLSLSIYTEKTPKSIFFSEKIF